MDFPGTSSFQEGDAGTFFFPRRIIGSVMREEKLPLETLRRITESAYEYVRIRCPVCGARSEDGCPHRAFVTDRESFTALSPGFELWTREALRFTPEEELSLGSLVPRRLWGRVRGIPELALASARLLNDKSGSGPFVTVTEVLSPARHDRRLCGFFTEDGLRFLRENGGEDRI